MTTVSTIEPARRKQKIPLTAFNPSQLDDDVELSTDQSAKWLNRSPETLKAWRRIPNHGLKWRKVGRRISYKARDIRAFLK